MRHIVTLTALGWLLASLAAGQHTGTGDTDAREPVRFAAIDIYVDSENDALAAYQIELTTAVGHVAIVGIEGGQPAAFAAPPYYDPKALNDDRLIIAAFDTGDELPTGRNRVARVHVQITGQTEPEYDIDLTVAAGADGEPITAQVSIEQGVVE